MKTNNQRSKSPPKKPLTVEGDPGFSIYKQMIKAGKSVDKLAQRQGADPQKKPAKK